MSDETAFLRTILENPLDDAPRLVFADWLDERGDPRGEFIRRQIQTGKIRYADNVPHKLADRGPGQLLETWTGVVGARDWLPPPTSDTRFNAEFRRGFCVNLECGIDWFLKHAPNLFQTHPIFTVRLTDRVPDRIDRDHLWYCTDPLYPDAQDRTPDKLPPALFNCLVGGEFAKSTNPRFFYDEQAFDSRAEAVLSLSRACVSFGRKAAGLPPLHPLIAGNRSANRSAAAS